MTANETEAPPEDNSDGQNGSTDQELDTEEGMSRPALGNTEEQSTAEDTPSLPDRVQERWDEADYDIDDVENWAPLEGRIGFMAESLSPEALSSGGESGPTRWEIENQHLNSRVVQVMYGYRGVRLSLDGKGEDIMIFGGATFTPEQARTLGAALYQAGEELERWREAENDGGDGQ